MAIKLPPRSILRAGVGGRPAFRVVMAYDDFASGKRAMGACNFLGGKLGKGIELRTSMWKFDLLRNEKLNQMAVDEAIEADVIIVANARNAGLPEEARRWVDGWIPRKRSRPAALVALVDFTGENLHESTLAYAFLKGAAASAKIDFLPQEIRLRENRAPDPSAAAKRAFLPVPDGALPPPTPEGWGIND